MFSRLLLFEGSDITRTLLNHEVFRQPCVNASNIWLSTDYDMCMTLVYHFGQLSSEMINLNVLLYLCVDQGTLI